MKTENTNSIMDKKIISGGAHGLTMFVDNEYSLKEVINLLKKPPLYCRICQEHYRELKKKREETNELCTKEYLGNVEKLMPTLLTGFYRYKFRSKKNFIQSELLAMQLTLNGDPTKSYESWFFKEHVLLAFKSIDPDHLNLLVRLNKPITDAEWFLEVWEYCNEYFNEYSGLKYVDPGWDKFAIPLGIDPNPFINPDAEPQHYRDK
jgi:hypothetical protein